MKNIAELEPPLYDQRRIIKILKSMHSPSDNKGMHVFVYIGNDGDGDDDDENILLRDFNLSI